MASAADASSLAVVIDPTAPCASWPPAEWEAVGQSLFPTFELDLFQKHAVCAIARGENLLVTAKTGCGKTAVAEYQIAHSLARGGRVFYTTPIKSLSNQKFSELRKRFPQASVGILTGDTKFSPDAQIIVMTQEILRNRCVKRLLGCCFVCCMLRLRPWVLRRAQTPLSVPRCT